MVRTRATGVFTVRNYISAVVAAATTVVRARDTEKILLIKLRGNTANFSPATLPLKNGSLRFKWKS